MNELPRYDRLRRLRLVQAPVGTVESSRIRRSVPPAPRTARPARSPEPPSTGTRKDLRPTSAGLVGSGQPERARVPRRARRRFPLPSRTSPTRVSGIVEDDRFRRNVALAGELGELGRGRRSIASSSPEEHRTVIEERHAKRSTRAFELMDHRIDRAPEAPADASSTPPAETGRTASRAPTSTGRRAPSSVDRN